MSYRRYRSFNKLHEIAMNFIFKVPPTPQKTLKITKLQCLYSIVHPTTYSWVYYFDIVSLLL